MEVPLAVTIRGAHSRKGVPVLVGTIRSDEGGAAGSRLRRLGVLLCFSVLAATAPLLLPAGAGGGEGEECKPRIRGITLTMHSPHPPLPYRKAVEEIAALEATHLLVVVHFYQPYVHRGSPRRVAKRTPTDAELLDVLRAASAEGLECGVMPILLLEHAGPDDWRGNLRPPDWEEWFAAYRRELLRFARTAEDGGASLFIVGSELSSTERFTERWRRLVHAVRGVFSGALTYSANWDHYEEVGFFGELDFLGLSGYYEVSDSTCPEPAQLVASWRRVRSALTAWRQREGYCQPLLFTELGYASQDGCSHKPWNYYLSKRVDLDEQRMCYEAFIRAWEGEPALAGVFFYEWYGRGGPDDTGYTPRGKPAESVLRRWFERLGGR